MELSPGEWLTIALFLCGLLIAALTNYLKFMNEFNYIKGQLSQILEIHGDFTELVEKHVKLERDLNKTFKDLDKAFLRIKIIEQKILDGMQ